MTDERHPDHRPLSSADADRLLRRAAELDADRGATVTQLREAAREAGISAAGFDAALAELQHRPAEAPAPATAPRRTDRGVRRRLGAAGLAVLLAVGAMVAVRNRPSGDAGAAPVTATAEEAFLLRCLAPGEAAELVRPFLAADRSARATIAPDHAPRVLTIRATPARLAQVRALLAERDGAGSPACIAAPAGPPARGTP